MMTNITIEFNINILLLILVVSVSALVDNSNPQSSTNGCCDQCNEWKMCKGNWSSQNLPVECAYAKFDKSRVKSSLVASSCGKPSGLTVKVDISEDISYLNVSWMFPQDSTISRAIGFLVVISSGSDKIKNDDVVVYFNITGNDQLDAPGLENLSDVAFVYDCLRAFPYTRYNVSVKTLPSNKKIPAESSVFNTDLLPNYDVNCSSRWIAYMFVKVSPPQVTVCFWSAPAMFGMYKYVVHVMTPQQDRDNQPSDYLTNIKFDKLRENGEKSCLNITLREPGEYIAKLQPDTRCFCYGEQEICYHTSIPFTMPAVTTSSSFKVSTSSSFKVSTSSSFKVSTTPPWNVALIASLVSTVTIISITVIVIFCFFNRLKDFFYNVFFMILETDTKVLVVFLPSSDAKTNEAIKDFIYRLKFKSRAVIHTMPKIQKSKNKLLQTATDCVKLRDQNSPSPSTSLSCKCKFCGLNVDNNDRRLKEELKEELKNYNQLIILHSEESSKILDVYTETVEMPIATCRAFMQMVGIYGCISGGGDCSTSSIICNMLEEDHSPVDLNIQSTLDLNIQTPVELNIQSPDDLNIQSPEDLNIQSPEDLNIQTPEDLNIQTPVESNIQTPEDLNIQTPEELDTVQEIESRDSLPQRVDSGFYSMKSRISNSSEIRYEVFNIEVQNIHEEENQADKERTPDTSTETLEQTNNSKPELVPEAEDTMTLFNCSDCSKSIDISFARYCTCSSPVIMHAILNKDADINLISKVFNDPPIYNVDYDFSAITKSITNPQPLTFQRPSLTCET